mgnify:CR=1 FL=1
MRGSDPDATLYWLAKMIHAGEDPRFIARRIIVHAAEDVGLADPMALVLANAAFQAAEFIGWPEARIPIAEAAIYVACANKSNSVIKAIDAALNDIRTGKTIPVPNHLKDSHYAGAEALKHGAGYKYAHDFPNHFVAQDYLGDAIAELQRFLKVYPFYENLDYIYYLMAVCYYEQIVDEKKDLQSIINAKKTFEIVINNYPNTEYSLDSEFKLDLINDILASKEMYIGRYYFDKKKWVPAINRFRTVIDEYDRTIYTEEALHRLVEVHYILGLIKESEKYANILGYNYKSSQWYEKSYIIFNKKYKKNSIDKIKKDKKKNGLLKKIKSLVVQDE